LVPEQMFSTEEAPANGISAVKAIQLAAAEGQKIYTITQANLSIALQQLQLSSEIKADIRNAVSAGMEVTTHQKPVNFFGSPSVGYILLDPSTGAGAYRIGGGENGALLLFIGLVSLMMIGIIIMASGGLGLAAAGGAILSATAIALGNIFRGLSIILDATGNSGYLSSALCNLATYSYASGFFALVGLSGFLFGIFSNIWANYAAGGVMTALLTPLCT
jgi:hypothetical protein